MLSKDLENALNELFKECSENSEEFVTIEHLLLVLTKEESSRKIFEHLSVDVNSLEKEVKDYIKKNVPKTKRQKTNIIIFLSCTMVKSLSQINYYLLLEIKILILMKILLQIVFIYYICCHTI